MMKTNNVSENLDFQSVVCKRPSDEMYSAFCVADIMIIGFKSGLVVTKNLKTGVRNEYKLKGPVSITNYNSEHVILASYYGRGVVLSGTEDDFEETHLSWNREGVAPPINCTLEVNGVVMIAWSANELTVHDSREINYRNFRPRLTILPPREWLYPERVKQYPACETPVARFQPGKIYSVYRTFEPERFRVANEKGIYRVHKKSGRLTPILLGYDIFDFNSAGDVCLANHESGDIVVKRAKTQTYLQSSLRRKSTDPVFPFCHITSYGDNFIVTDPMAKSVVYIKKNNAISLMKGFNVLGMGLDGVVMFDETRNLIHYKTIATAGQVSYTTICL